MEKKAMAQMALNLIAQILALFLGTLFLAASVVMIRQRWNASEGPSAVALLESKTIEIGRRGHETHLFLVAFKPKAAESVWARAEVSEQTYLAHTSGDSVKIHYQSSDPLNVTMDSEGWFPWISIVTLGFGISFMYVVFIVKPVETRKVRKVRKRKSRSR